jgi:sulfane dehydrogenase subunit SoxC
MTKKQIEFSAKDISAVEKPTNRARLVTAPEHFISQDLIADINSNGLDETRRGFLRKGFLSAIGGAAASLTAPLAFAAEVGYPAILEKQEWQTTLGKNVATMPYGVPSIYEANLIRRESPGLTRVSAASVAFTPLQGLFGTITQMVCILSGTIRAGTTSIQKHIV